MNKLVALLLLLASTGVVAYPAPPAPLRVAIVGLRHDHVLGFLAGGSLAPAGGILHRGDVELVGIVDPDKALFDTYAQRFHLAQSLYYPSIGAMVAHAHPAAVLAFTAPSEHRQVVEQCAALGVHVMMEKPLAFSYPDALAIARAAHRGRIHVLVDFETSWYSSNTQAYNLLQQGALGPVVKTVFRDGHQGPKKIGVSAPFLGLLIDPGQDGDGALTDFGCYGPDLMTWLMHGEAPLSVTAVTKRLQPELYPEVDDQAEILLNYQNATALVEGSWDWPFSVKQMDVYGRTGYARTLDAEQVEVRRENETAAQRTKGDRLEAPYDDPLHYLEAVLSGQVEEGDSLSSLKTNVTVAEILDAARQSARTGRTVQLPLAP